MASSRGGMGGSRGRVEAAELADALLQQLGLGSCAGTLVSGVSGGEAKRTSIGLALLAAPKVLRLLLLLLPLLHVAWLGKPTKHTAHRILRPRDT